MKFILDKDKVQILDKHNLKSGSINYYIAEVEHDESWDNLTIEARIVRKENGIIQEVGKSIAVINNEMYIDKELSGTYAIGFIGYTIEDNVKTMQISTNLVGLYFNMGAGEIEVNNSQEIPTPSEWETYLAQVQEFMNNATAKINQANNLDLDVSKTGKVATVTITKKDNTTKSVEINDGADGKDGISTIIYYDTDETLTIETIDDAEEVSY
jgi:hypothetical protein